ncbi:hypothetical protein CFU_1249 [Collimonas fungivorans Ter331]|uniref:Uncharacterized protein n=1 Tax=Collimonas fungivorans (strain Ter331) TaxID=1005048 RepID=G0AJE7_COLFT|nr:hypothetical protein CFU_1249 [Collimonas fungivorans Ter331]
MKRDFTHGPGLPAKRGDHEGATGAATNSRIFQVAGGCRGACLMYNSNFPHVPFGTFCND